MTNTTPTAAEPPIKWTLNGDTTCSYTNWLGETPFGRILITWKDWKDDPDACVDEFPGGFAAYGSPDSVKAACGAEFASRATLAQAPAQPAAAPLRQEWTIPVELPDGRIAKMRKCDLRPDDMVAFIDGDNLPPAAPLPVAQAGVLTEDQERKAFDAWFKHNSPLTLNEEFAGWTAWQARAALAAPQPNPWREAIDDELVTAHLGTADSFATPREALQALIDWHCVVSLDPAVSSDAALLVERGRADQAAYARRYRWLRNWWFGGASAVTEDRIHQALTMEELDAAIDAELGREGGKV